MSCQEHPLKERIKHTSPFSIHCRRTARVQGEMTKHMHVDMSYSEYVWSLNTHVCWLFLVGGFMLSFSWFSTIPGDDYRIDRQIFGAWGGTVTLDHFYEARCGIDGRNRASHSPSPQNEWNYLVWRLVGILVGICACCFLVIYGMNILAHSIGFDGFCCTVMVFFQPFVGGSHWVLVRSCKCKSVVTPKISRFQATSTTKLGAVHVMLRFFEGDDPIETSPTHLLQYKSLDKPRPTGADFCRQYQAAEF